MADRIFFNLTNHELTEEQKNLLKELGFDIYSKEILYSQETIAKLLQSPDDVEELIAFAKYVAEKLSRFVNELKQHQRVTDFWIHLPVGSPLFQSLLFANLVELLSDYPEVRLVFSHSKRIVEEDKETGKKVSYFKFEKFLIVNPKEVKVVLETI